MQSMHLRYIRIALLACIFICYIGFMKDYLARTLFAFVIIAFPIFYLCLVFMQINAVYVIVVYGTLMTGAIWSSRYRVETMRLKFRCWIASGMIGLMVFDALQSYLEVDKNFLSHFYIFYPFGILLIVFFQILILFLIKELPQDNRTKKHNME